MSAAIFGYLMGVILVVTLIPAVVGGLFRRASPPSKGWIIGAWILAVLLAISGAYGGGMYWPQVIALALLGALTHARFSAWADRPGQSRPSGREGV